jgi:nickel-type superoxide dismutase maturation protease
MLFSKKLKPPNLIFSLFPFYKFRITGLSMTPVLKNGDFVLVNRLAYFFKKPKKGDVIAVYDPRDKKVLIKRIINIQNKKYFIQGDNKKASTDSRKFGMIEKKSILGKVIYI